MKKFMVVCFVFASFSSFAHANNRHYRTNNVRSVAINNSSAQGVAETMASQRCVTHYGGHSAYEGCGSGYSQREAYNNCCYSRDGNLFTYDVGYAQDSSGKWYCCRRYRNK
jgi:hypothetical protein